MSEHAVRAFYRDRKGSTCKDLGDFYECRLNKRDGEPADGECALCKRLDAFRRQIEEEEEAMAEKRLKAAIAREEESLAKSEERIAGSKDRSEKLHVRALQREMRMRIQALRYALSFVLGEKKEE